MPGFLVRLLVNAVGLWLAALIVPGVTVTGPLTLLLAALLMGIVNALIRPVVILLTLPLTIVTFGIFLLVVNAAMFGLVAWLLGGFEVDGFWAALFGWLIVSIVSWIASWYIGPRGRYEILVVEKARMRADAAAERRAAAWPALAGAALLAVTAPVGADEAAPTGAGASRADQEPSGASFAGAPETSPFRTRNLSPLVSIFGIPAWSGGGAASRLGLTAELANHYRFSRRGDETLILDGETWRAALFHERRLGERWTLGVEIPYYRQWGGMLDDVIDAWHSAFGLPDGGRNLRGEDRIAFLLAGGGGPFYTLGGADRGFGDVLLGVGRDVGLAGGMHLRATLKLPTGDEALLAGSGSADLAVTLLKRRGLTVRGRPAGFFWGFGGIVVGEPERVLFSSRRGALLGVLGGGLKPWPRIGVKAQLDVHGALYDSPLEEIGDPGIQATLGAWREIGERTVVEVAINEDLAVSTSPDLVVHAVLKWTFDD